MSRLTQRVLRLGPRVRLVLVGLIVGTLTATVVSAWIDSRLTELMLSQVAARARDQVQLGILNSVRDTDFEPPYSAEKKAALAARLDPLLARARQSDSGIIRLNLFARDGTIVYSDLASLRGQMISPLGDELLARALAGEPNVEISDLVGAENADLRSRYGRALEAYIPFSLDGQVVGVYEFYEDLAPVAPIRPLVWSSVAAGSAVMCACVGFVAGASTASSRPRTVAPSHRPGPVVGPSTPNGQLLHPTALAQPLLTRREAEVLRLMAEGLTYSQIAGRLVVDEETVRSHAKGVLRKLGQSSRARAVVAAREAGIL